MSVLIMAVFFLRQRASRSKYDSFIQLADYKNLSVEAPDDTVIADGMTVNIDYTGKLNGNAQ